MLRHTKIFPVQSTLDIRVTVGTARADPYIETNLKSSNNFKGFFIVGAGKSGAYIEANLISRVSYIESRLYNKKFVLKIFLFISRIPYLKFKFKFNLPVTAANVISITSIFNNDLYSWIVFCDKFFSFLFKYL
jgi:hypothetical protein